MESYIDDSGQPASIKLPTLFKVLDKHLSDNTLKDAQRWQALIGCGRIRPLGSAGLHRIGPIQLYGHLGVELWTVFDMDDCSDPKVAENTKASHETGKQWLTRFVDKVIKAKENDT